MKDIIRAFMSEGGSTMAALLPRGVEIGHPEMLFIGGEWVAPKNGGTIEVVSPDTEDVVARVAEATEPDMDAAVAAAREAFERGPWPRASVSERVSLLRRMAKILEGRHHELAEAYRSEIGALREFAGVVANGGTKTFEDFADIGESFDWVTRRESTGLPGHDAIVVREPVGVVAAIAPWNVPYSIMALKIAPALVAGCTVIMKPSPETPLEAYIIAEVAEEAGLPPGVLNLAPAHREAADHLVRSKGVDKVSFTGSTAAGRRVASVVGENLTRVTLELGGKSPAIVLEDYPTEAAGPLLARTISMLSGQVCTMLSRAIVPARRHDEIAEAIASEMRKIKIGHSDDPNAEMGPIAMKRQLARVEGYVAKGIEQGARLVCGGCRPADMDRGYFYEPTLFANVDNEMTIAQEEIFGPVLCLIPAHDLDHAIEIANDTSYGLNASVLTSDPEKVVAIARRILSGNVAQNGMKGDTSLPFGGFKMSGIGREGGTEGILPYIETKTIIVEHAGR
jgi:acyl-CoA reductase-like NAD-dependent aldehyde dehydrogenase